MIAQGETCFSHEFNDALITALKNPEVTVDQMAMMLTDREREVAVMIAKSFSSKEVAVALNISVKTAQNHRTNLMRKLNVHDSAGVIRFAIRQGLYEPAPYTHRTLPKIREDCKSGVAAAVTNKNPI